MIASEVLFIVSRTGTVEAITKFKVTFLTSVPNVKVIVALSTKNWSRNS